MQSVEFCTGQLGIGPKFSDVSTNGLTATSAPGWGISVFGVALIMGHFAWADAAASEAHQSAAGAGDGNVPKTLPADCGDSATSITHTTKAPPRMEAENPSDADWLAYELMVRQHFDLPGLPPETAADATAPQEKTVEGCALEQWDSTRMAAGMAPEEGPIVTFTKMDGTRSQPGKGAEENLQSAGGRNLDSGENLPSAKQPNLQEVLRNLVDTKAFHITAYSLLAALAAFGVLQLMRMVLARLFRRKSCRIDAVLATTLVEFKGQIQIIGKRDCKFVPDNFQVLDALLDTPDFLDFSITVGALTEPVFISRTQGAGFLAFFAKPLAGSTLAAILHRSSIEAQPVKWAPSRASSRDGLKTVRSRLARLREMREEELARRAT
ncbi:MAG: hypothetical protein ACJAVM_001707 [Sulfitobacter sp.]|jgi:hypothetical protein